MNNVELILSGKTNEAWYHMKMDIDSYMEYQDPDIYDSEYLEE